MKKLRLWFVASACSLAGAAGAAVAAGLSVVVVRGASSERKQHVPTLKLRVSSERAIASAGWRF